VRFRRPSLGTILGALALFVALGGPSQAARLFGSGDIKNNSIRSADVKNRSLRGTDVKNNTLTGRQIRESRLGKVRTAKNADQAAALAGLPAAAFLRANALTPPASTTPTLQNNWVATGGVSGPPRFYRDATGRVHLTGAAKDGTVDSSVFTLPVGFRPKRQLAFVVECDKLPGGVTVNPSGVVIPFDHSTAFNVTGGTGTVSVRSDCNQFLTLDGVSFRAGD